MGKLEMGVGFNKFATYVGPSPILVFRDAFLHRDSFATSFMNDEVKLFSIFALQGKDHHLARRCLERYRDNMSDWRIVVSVRQYFEHKYFKGQRNYMDQFEYAVQQFIDSSNENIGFKSLTFVEWEE